MSGLKYTIFCHINIIFGIELLVLWLPLNPSLAKQALEDFDVTIGCQFFDVHRMAWDLHNFVDRNLLNAIWLTKFR
jgi:hypothetical protein